MSSGKWDSEVGRGTPAREAACRVLAERLAVLREALGESLKGGCAEPEPIHQLRVASRRATAGVEGFDVCLEPRKARKLCRLLRTLRRAAGRTRDWDVFLEEIAQQHEACVAADAAGPDVLFGYSVARREEAQCKLLETCGKALKRLPRKADKLVVTNGGVRSGVTLGELGDARLKELAGSFGSRIKNPLVEVADFHALRLALKPLRYTVEIFSDCFDPPLRDQVYPRLEELQNLLGVIQDGQVAFEHVRDLHAGLNTLAPPGRSRYAEPLRALEARLEYSVAKRCQAVLEWREASAHAVVEDLERILSGRPPSESAPALRQSH